MSENPIVEEVHRTREQLLAEFGGDFDAFVTDLQRRTTEAARAGAKVMPLPPPRQPQDRTTPTKKAG
jgi:hypothetical protein